MSTHDRIGVILAVGLAILLLVVALPERRAPEVIIVTDTIYGYIPVKTTCFPIQQKV